MYFEVFSIIAPVFILSCVGFSWARLQYEFPSDFIAHMYELEGTLRGVVLIQASMPVAVFSYLLNVQGG